MLKGSNMKNFIPLLNCLDEKAIFDVNNFEGYNEVLGFKD